MLWDKARLHTSDTYETVASPAGAHMLAARLCSLLRARVLLLDFAAYSPEDRILCKWVPKQCGRTSRRLPL